MTPEAIDKIEALLEVAGQDDWWGHKIDPNTKKVDPAKKNLEKPKEKIWWGDKYKAKKIDKKK